MTASYQHIISRLIFSLLFVSSLGYSQTNEQEQTSEEQLKKANALIDIQPDSSFILYHKILPFFIETEDHHHIIACHIGISDVYKNRGQYSKAYDHLWDALIIAEESLDTASLIQINRDLGRLYSIYEKYDNALMRFSKALAYAKSYKDLNKMKHIKFHNLYYSLAVTNRKAKNYEKALNYLDSCTLSRPQTAYDNSPYINIERGCIYLEIEDFKNAEQHLQEAYEYFNRNQLSYLIISSLHLGDLYYQQEKWDSASLYYNTCLHTLNNFNSHGDVAAIAHKRLAISLGHLNKTEEAYTHLNSALAITDSLFNAKTAINSELFQMKNKYKETIQEQKLVIERKNIIQMRLILFIALITVALIALLIYIRMRHQLHESSLRRKKVELQAQLDQEKAAEILELKNRELTANTLKIIDKEQTIEELLATIKKDSPANYKSLKIKSSLSNKEMWEQFNMRFIEVNAHFYDDLRAKHPDLTPTEHKHCALIKLNFDSKEMASLLNISLSSVHISRHRIRKKMGLEREDSLSNYIAKISR